MGGASQSPLPPFACGVATQTLCVGLPPPFTLSPYSMCLNGVAHDTRATQEAGVLKGSGGVEGKRGPSPIAEHDPTCRSCVHDPCAPAFQVPHGCCPACGMACARWRPKGGCAGVMHAGRHTGLYSHTHFPARVMYEREVMQMQGAGAPRVHPRAPICSDEPPPLSQRGVRWRGGATPGRVGGAAHKPRGGG